MKRFRYLIEAALLFLAFALFKIMGPAAASAMGGFIGRSIGPRLGASRKALTNLHRALPGQTDDEYALILRDMWDNLGRVMAEFPHLKTIARHRTEIRGLENVPADGRPFVFITAHTANWEVAHVALHVQPKIKFNLTYRSPNNPYIAGLVEACRRVDGQLPMLSKSRAGTRGMVESMGDGNPLLILIDQKYNEGISVPFMGHPAMTSDAFVRFSRKFNAPVIPFRMERLKGCRFRLTILPALPTGGRAPESVIADAHTLLEGWIREKPGQWLWLHRRWNFNAPR